MKEWKLKWRQSQIDNKIKYLENEEWHKKWQVKSNEFEKKVKELKLEFEEKENKSKINDELQKRLAIWDEIKEIDIYSSDVYQASRFQRYWEKIYKERDALGDFNYARIAELFVQLYSGKINIKELNEEITNAPIDELLAIFRDLKFTHNELGIFESDLIHNEVNNEKGGWKEETIKEWQKTDTQEQVSDTMGKESTKNNSPIIKSIKWLLNSDQENNSSQDRN